MSEVPEDVLALVEERERARQAREFARADDLRERIREAGFEVTDADSGPVLATRDATAGVEPDRGFSRAEDVPSLLAQPVAFSASVQWVVEGWPEDVRRGIDAFDRRCPGWAIQHVVVELTRDVSGGWPVNVDVVRMAPQAGWAAARNAGLRRAAAPVVVVMDGSIEPEGDVLTPLAEALAEPGVGLTGPFGIVSSDLREF